jgi:hypothetical protein
VPIVGFERFQRKPYRMEKIEMLLTNRQILLRSRYELIDDCPVPVKMLVDFLLCIGFEHWKPCSNEKRIPPRQACDSAIE